MKPAFSFITRPIKEGENRYLSTSLYVRVPITREQAAALQFDEHGMASIPADIPLNREDLETISKRANDAILHVKE